MTLCVTTAFACAATAWGLNWWGHAQANLSPTADAWSATVGALLAWQGFHLAILALMAPYLVARRWCGHLLPRQRAALDNTVLFWAWTALQGVLVVALVQLLPGWMA